MVRKGVNMKLKELRSYLDKDTVGIHRARIAHYLISYDKNYVCPYGKTRKKDSFGRPLIETVEELLSYPDWEREFLRTPYCGRVGLKLFKKLLTKKGYDV
tara:strand:+ start:100 stop:399 length:300 start_codon:yes stop_codon:yes gene_type:complete